MPLPVLLAVHEDRDVLASLEAQLAPRYARDYRVDCLADAEAALELLAELADEATEVALVLAGDALWDHAGGAGLDQVRTRHPHAKRALLIEPEALTDRPTAVAIRDSVALGRVDYYVIVPAPGLDEGFHQAVTSF